jgi:anthranilate synthase/aminodeoxychorismate synthase-like glutamine amidotransferase
MKVLLLDNYDSFTWNIYDYIRRSGIEVLVKKHDAISVADIRKLSIAGIVLSPGPGRPEQAGILMETIAEFHTKLPVFGVCLGYQAIGAYFGASVIHSQVPMHGKTSRITHSGTGIFHQIPQHTPVMRYHSLNIDRVPDGFQCTARTVETDEFMAMAHENLPVTGVQFHPESVGTPEGAAMITNWINSLH